MAEIVKTVVFFDGFETAYIDEFSVPTEDFNLKRAIRNVAVKYYMTEEGRSPSHWNKDGSYNYNDFYKHALEKLCPEHGFHKIRRIKDFVEIDINDELISFIDMLALDEAIERLAKDTASGIFVVNPKFEFIFDPQDDVLPNQEEKENMNCMETLEESAKNLATQKKIYETAVQFARKWGVMETLDGTLPNQGTEENMNCMIAWATEFVNSGETDSVDFFEHKLNEVKKKEAKMEQTNN